MQIKFSRQKKKFVANDRFGIPAVGAGNPTTMYQVSWWLADFDAHKTPEKRNAPAIQKSLVSIYLLCECWSFFIIITLHKLFIVMYVRERKISDKRKT